MTKSSADRSLVGQLERLDQLPKMGAAIANRAKPDNRQPDQDWQPGTSRVVKIENTPAVIHTGNRVTCS